MRVIKFRGKRIGRWVYGFFVGINPEKENISHIISRDKEIYEVYSETVGQFTGLTDNNGKEIYEGDILSDNCCNRKCEHHLQGVVIYNDGKFVVGNSPYFRDGNGVKFEVIGNIHDNKELLNQK